MEDLLDCQSKILEEIKRILSNFKKDSRSRKTAEYIGVRVSALDKLWSEFVANHSKLETVEDKSHQYFRENIVEFVKSLYSSTRETILSFKIDQPITFDTQSNYARSTDTDTTQGDKISELKRSLMANFRAFYKLIKGICIDNLYDKWEIEDEIKSLQSRWEIIVQLHLQIDTLLAGSEAGYETEYTELEISYKDIKKSLNKKLSSFCAQQESTPKINIPNFYGDYMQWPTFMDLYSEAIHNNPNLSKTQKMQHLKGKLKGEAGQQVQHLRVTADNYDTCWEFLTHRYNNKQLLFTAQLQLLLTQPKITNQSALELKKLLDTSMEAIHAMHNLGINTTTWDPFLVHILCDKLDTETYADYVEARKDPRDLPALDEFMEFLEGKFIALEPINSKNHVQTKGKNRQINSHTQYKPQQYEKRLTKPSTNNYVFHAGNPNTCPFCNSNHALYQCKKFLSMSPNGQLNSISKLNICKNCLYVHHKNYCNSEKRCRECNDAHNTLLHNTFTNPSASSTLGNQQKKSNYTAGSDDEVILPTALINVLCHDGTYLTLRALVDQASQTSILTEDAAQRLGLARQQYNASIKGVGTLSHKCRGKVQLTCKSRLSDYQFHTEALVMSRVVGNLPNASFDRRDLQHIKHLSLADPDYNISRPIDILLDSEIYSKILMNGLLKGPGREPIAQQTHLGWILSGSSGVVKSYNCHVIVNNMKEIEKYWEIEDITNDTNTALTSQEQFCEEFYKKTTTRLANGRYQVQYPMKENFTQYLGNSKVQATAQFLQLEKRLARDSSLSESYKKFIDEYLHLGHMRRCEAKNTLTTECFLPHHAVTKEDSSTTKLRVVFNASQKTTTVPPNLNRYSLNDLMECGPKLHNDLQALLIKWRLHRYVFTADCEKMYRMIMVADTDRKLQKIIWRSNPQHPLQEYELCTLTYGTKAAPFLALRTLKQVSEDEPTYKLGGTVLQNDIYMDDVLSGADSLDTAQNMQCELIEMLGKAGLNLRKWASNNIALLQNLTEEQLNPSVMDFNDAEVTKTLGLQWVPTTDNFQFKIKICMNTDKPHTKRMLLSDISKIFDPLGWLSPVTVKAKLLFQTLWTTNCDWDDVIQHPVQREWDQFRKEINIIEQLEIPRWTGDTSSVCQLHGFCDASEKMYACSIYVTTINSDNKRVSRLLVAKTKLAPSKSKLTLPKLELSGALLLAKLFEKVLRSFNNQHKISTYAWTDSMIVLGWLNGDASRWKMFVANRVKQITSIIPAKSWNHVSSENNAADCATRGMTAAQLMKHDLWWHGPSWLQTFDSNNITSTRYESPQIEEKINKACFTHTLPSSIVIELLNKYSDIDHIARIIAWILRFGKSKNDTRSCTAYLTTNEILTAYDIIIRNIQMHEFSDERSRLQTNKGLSSKSNILSLNPYLDKNNIMRVGGRLRNAIIKDDSKNPIILTSHSRLTELLINQAHKQTLHGGPRLTLCHLRQRFWIISGYRTVKKQLHRCVICQRFKSQQQHQLMADLPAPRVTPSRPFTHVGVDFTGNVEIKANKGRGIRTLKAYIAVFVCLATKAIHLELVSDLSTISFLAALKRFCSRRGKPSDIYSDNGTNFVGANKVLKREYKEILKCIDNDSLRKINEQGIRWHLNVPKFPSGGGLWEAAVKSMKHHLKRVIGDQKLTYEEFTTLLCQIEACLNSRPLCQLTESTDDLEVLTPGHFLIGDPMLSIAEPENTNVDLKSRWQIVQQMKKAFWKKWSEEYLQQLQARQKWRTPTKNVQINDIVCIKEDNLPPGKWALGRVMTLHPGKDGYVRVVTLKTKHGLIKRPLVKLAPLLTNENNSEQKDFATDTAPAKRRSVKKTSLKTYFINALLLFLTLFTSSLQQAPPMFKVTEFQANQSLYFDRVSSMQQIKDTWNLIIYYNMTTYWQHTENLQTYVTHLKGMKKEDWVMQFQAMAMQLDHSMSELQYYNSILKYQNVSSSISRTRRGLINGVGYLANELFGVLDERFAQKYENDIKTIEGNENHLLHLLKNQTSILEAEQNIVMRNEAIMNKQFSLINEHWKNATQNINKLELATQTAFYVLTSSIIANNLLSEMRRIQETLIDLAADIYQGHLNIHLFTPKLLQDQLDIIFPHLPEDRALPVTRDNIRDIYKLIKPHARVTESYLIIEIKIPLISKEQYELDKIYSIPQIRNDKRILNIIPLSDYIAYNIKKDSFVLVNSADLRNCIHMNDQKSLCTLNHAEYSIELHQNICNIKLFTNSKYDTFCRSEIKACADKWIELHDSNTWMFTCCQKCYVRILCPAGLTSHHFYGVGMITLGQGCVMKADSIMIYANNNKLTGRLALQQEIYIPSISSLNGIMNTSTDNFTYQAEGHLEQFEKINRDLKQLREQSTLDNGLSSHDLNHYIGTAVLFGILSIIAVAAGCYVCRSKRTKNKKVMCVQEPRVISVQSVPMQNFNTGSQCNKIRKSKSVVNFDTNIDDI